MTIQAGDRLPEVVVQRIGEGVETVDTRALFDHKKVVIFAVPGAFTPTCSEKHLPGYVEHMDAFRKRGVEVACIAVNDPFVMQAWGRSQHVPDDLMMLADGNGDFTRALGLEMDASAYGMGKRSRRFAIYAEDGVAREVYVEAPGEFRVSSAEYVLERIPDSANAGGGS
jgi:peroxiredoxin